MFPMVSEPWEYEQARKLFEEQVEWARKAHRKLPSGSNLARCSKCRPRRAARPTAAADRLPVDRHQRSDPVPVRRRPRRSAACPALRLAEPGDPAIPQARRSMQARAANVPVRICGEMAGRPLEAMALIGIGAEASRSLPPASARSRRWSARSTPARPGPGSISCWPSRPRTCARRLRTGRAGIRSPSDDCSDARLTGRASPQSVVGDVRAKARRWTTTRWSRRAYQRSASGCARRAKPRAWPRGHRRPDPHPVAPSRKPRGRQLGRSPGADLHDRLRQTMRPWSSSTGPPSPTNCAARWVDSDRQQPRPKCSSRSIRLGPCPNGWFSERSAR